MTLVLGALAVYKVMDLLQEATSAYGPWLPWFKSLLAIVLGLAIVLVIGESWLLGLAIAGLASLVHEVHAALNLAVDALMASVLSRGRVRR